MPLVSKAFSQIITFTRASTGTYFDSAGVLTSANSDIPRFDFNPSTLAAQGLLIEEQRTNSIRNNTMVGAVAGTPGTLPTNWSGWLAASGITREIIGTGTENGITYIDIKMSGTPSGNATFFMELMGTLQAAATNGQNWTSSVYLKLQAGATTNITNFQLRLDELDSGGILLAASTANLAPTSAALSIQRTALSRLFNNASTAFTRTALRFEVTTGNAIDITLRIGLPQLEQGAFATSVIPTTTTALTRSADVASVNTLSPWYNSASGTTYFEGVSFDTLTGAFPVAYQFNDGTSNNRIQITRNNSTSSARMAVVTGGVAQAAADATTWTLNATTKVALAYATNDFAIVANGGAPTTDTSGTVPTVTTLSLGVQFNGLSQLNGWLRRITYYPRRLSNAELQAITA